MKMTNQYKFWFPCRLSEFHPPPRARGQAVAAGSQHSGRGRAGTAEPGHKTNPVMGDEW